MQEDTLSPVSSPSFMGRVSDWMIPVQEGEDAEALTRRARLLLVVLALSAGNLVFTGIVHLLLGNDDFALSMICVFPLSLGIAVALRVGAPISILTHSTVALIFAVSLGIAIATGGRFAGGLFFIVLVPAVAILIVSRRAGLGWAAIVGLSLFAGGWFVGTDAYVPQFEMAEDQARGVNVRSTMLVMLAVSALTYFYATLHQKANESLKVSVAKFQQGERRFRAITEYAYDLIAELDGEGRFIFASPGFDEALGWSPEKLIGCSILDGVDPEDRSQMEASWVQLFEKGVVRQQPLRFATAFGAIRWFELSMRAFDSAEREPRVVVVARDVTERIEREKLLRHQHRLVAGGTMAAGAAHQLNNPLGAILAAAQYANQFKWNPAFGDLAGDSLDAIEEEARRSGQILRSMLAFAREEVSERWAEELGPVIRRAVHAIELEEAELETELVLSLCDEPCLVVMSPIEIEQVIINLVRNAIQADAKVVVVGLDIVEELTVRISISDDGTGLDLEDDSSDIFDAFFTTRPSSGSGLGLTVAQEIVVAHGGIIQVERSDGEATIFRIELPVARLLS